MRQLCWWFPLVVFANGCSNSSLPLTPTNPVAGTPSVSPSPPLPNRDGGNWTPWLFTGWQPGVGAPLGATVGWEPDDDATIADLT